MSAGGMIYVVVAILFGLFLHIAGGAVVDKLEDTHIGYINSGQPVTQDSVDTFDNLMIVWDMFVVFGVFLPLMIYGIIVARRQDDSMVI